LPPAPQQVDGRVDEQLQREAGGGIVSFISNSSFLAGRSHPLMRESLLTRFDDIWVDNLHGNRLASERTPQGDSCETIFNTDSGGPGIKVGTSITTFLKRGGQRPKTPSARVRVRDFWGRADAKRRALLASLDLESTPAKAREECGATPEGPRPYEDVTPTESGMWRLVSTTAFGSYEDWPALDDLFVESFQGVNPARGLEGSVVETDAAILERRMRDYFSDMSFEQLAERHPVLCQPRARYEPKSLRKELLARTNFRSGQIVAYQVFPGDLRWIYYETEAKLLTERSPQLGDHLAHGPFLVAGSYARRVSEARPIWSSTLFDYHLQDRGAFGFPRRLQPKKSELRLFAEAEPSEPAANLTPAVWKALAAQWQLKGDLTSKSALSVVDQLFALVLAIGHAPRFEADHAESLAQDWLHLPIPRDKSVLKECAALGTEVGALLDPATDPTKLLTSLLGARRRHLAVIATRSTEAVHDADLVVTVSYFGAAPGKWIPRRPTEDEGEAPAWGEQTGDLWLNDAVYLKNVPERVWRYELGGYPVLKKWLGYRDAKRRDGRPVTLAELDHLRGMVQRLAALLLLHAALDAAYEKAAADAFTATDLGLK
jgi:hypothetical protein